MIRSIYITALSTAALFLLPVLTLADNAGTSSGPEMVDGEFGEAIFVTARKREENVQEVPISITSFDASELESRSVADSLNLSLLATERAGYSRSLITGQRYDDADREAGRLSLDYAPSAHRDAARRRGAGRIPSGGSGVKLERRHGPDASAGARGQAPRPS